MIYVKVETQRVYSHGADGMPKIEKIEQTFNETFEFPKFLKYLPYQGYLVDRLKVTRVFDSEKEYDTAKWQKMLADVVVQMNVPEKNIHDKYEEEKQRNDELQKRLEALEAMLKEAPEKEEETAEKPETPENKQDEKPKKPLTRGELSRMYLDRFGQKPHHLWTVDKLKEKLGIN
jgi:hypothetical protein